MEPSAPTRAWPLVVAHRGASGYLAEHTLQAKALAHAQGADYLEQDLVATRDGRVIVCHDLFLERVTDVAEVFPQRCRRDGHFYAIDFDSHEIAELSVVGGGTPDAQGVPRSALIAADEPMRLCTLEEELEFIHRLNASSGRRAGVYPEIKKPRWHAEQGFDLSRAVLDVLARYGYTQPDDPVFVQCFDAAELRRVKEELGAPLRLVQLVGRSSDPVLLTSAGLAGIAEYAVALGANYRQLLRATDGRHAMASPLTAAVRAAGLRLHAYTFNRKHLPHYAASLEDLLRLAYERIRPDAVFCDYPDVAVRLRRDGPPAG